MADTLIREVTAFQSNPLSPVPQYWTGIAYEKVQGAFGAPRTIIYGADGVALLTVTNAGYVQEADGANATLGAKADAVATTDIGTFSLLALFKRLLQGITTLTGRTPALGTALTATSSPVNIASDQVIPVYESDSFNHIAGATAGITIKGSAGTLRKVSINTKGTTATLTLYNSLTATGAVIAVIDLTTQVNTLFFDAAFSIGLTAVITGTVSDVTITFR